jgi:Subtilase family/PA domain
VNLTTAGCLFVAGAGNGGRAHFTAGSPATAPEALSVGASLKTSETGTYLALDVSAPTSVAGVYPVGQTAEGPNIADYGTFSGEAVPAEPATACDPLTNAADVDGKIAIVSRGTCAYNNKAETAAAAGAIAVLMIDNVPVDHPVDGMTIDPPIPYWSLRYDDGVALLAAAPLTVSLTDGVAADVNAGPDFAAVFSARGPSARRLLLKPDLLAPGANVVSAAMGMGTEAVAMSGTSMACPVVAGAAALFRQARPTLDPLEVKALMTSSAAPVVNSFGAPFPAQIAGAGRLQLDAAVNATVSARVDGLPGEVGVSFGSIRASSTVTESRTVVITNHDASDVTLDVSIESAIPRAGVTVNVDPETITVPSQGSATVTASVTVEPAGLDPTPVYDAFTNSIASVDFTSLGSIPSILPTEESIERHSNQEQRIDEHRSIMSLALDCLMPLHGSLAFLHRRRADLHNRLSVLSAADDHQQVGNQHVPVRTLQLESRRAKLTHGVAHDVHRALDDRLASIDERHRLLPHQHGLGDLGRVRQIVEAHGNDLDARRRHR